MEWNESQKREIKEARNTNLAYLGFRYTAVAIVQKITYK